MQGFDRRELRVRQAVRVARLARAGRAAQRGRIEYGQAAFVVADDVVGEAVARVADRGNRVVHQLGGSRRQPAAAKLRRPRA